MNDRLRRKFYDIFNKENENELILPIGKIIPMMIYIGPSIMTENRNFEPVDKDLPKE